MGKQFYREVVDMTVQRKKRIRVVGASHSFLTAEGMDLKIRAHVIGALCVSFGHRPSKVPVLISARDVI